MINKESYYNAKSVVYKSKATRLIPHWIWFILLLGVLILFLPWTQNIRTKGTVTTLNQGDRPQEMNVIIGGRIVKWWIKEGDFVKAGDTVVQVAEIKDEYFDPNLLERTQNQINAKQGKMTSYVEKARAYQNTIPLLLQQQKLKLEQLAVKRKQVQNKISSDSTEVIAAKVDLNIAKDQLERAQQMFSDGVLSKIDFERRNNNFQKSLAVLNEKENKLEMDRRELMTNAIETLQATQEYSEKIFKAQAEQSASSGEASNAQGEVEKLSNQLANYRIRKSNYFILAPQDGQIIKVKKAGINEIVKEGENLLEIVPTTQRVAIELFVEPMDQLLVNIGQEVRFIFDGYPAIVFSGWPQATYGTFKGVVKTVERNTQDNGTFRILVVPEVNTKKWPPNLRLGTGAKGIALLKDVPVWYELWRNLNGFPPEFYKPKVSNKKEEQKKK